MINSSQIGICILDISTKQDLINCYESIPKELKQNTIIASRNFNSKIKNVKQFDFKKDTGLSCLRNKGLAYFRTNSEIKFCFLINSNYAVLKEDFFYNVIKKASIFGTWFMTGPSSKTLPLEDTETNTTLSISNELNGDVVFLLLNLVKKFGYFEEHYLGDEPMDVLDYIIKLRNSNIYPPHPFNSIVDNDLYKSSSIIKNEQREQRDQLSYGFFYNKHKYIPGRDDPAGVTHNQLFSKMEEIQNNYARSI